MRVSRLTACLAAVLLGGVFALPLAGSQESRVQTARFSVHGPEGDRESVLAVWPNERPQNERWPVVVAFHGMGESKQGKEKGYRAWVDRYGLLQAFEALLGGSLTSRDFRGLVRDAQLKALNAELAARAFRGVFVVCVYTPDLLSRVSTPAKIDAFADWVANRLVSKVRGRFPVASSEPREVGVDGVSLGGMVALEVGLRYPDVFGTVGAIQPAIRGREAEIADRAARAMAQQRQTIRLLSSDEDPLLPVTRKLSSALRERHVAHALTVTPGGHDYTFNQGPGSLELLRFHDRALRDLRTK